MISDISSIESSSETSTPTLQTNKTNGEKLDKEIIPEVFIILLQKLERLAPLGVVDCTRVFTQYYMDLPHNIISKNYVLVSNFDEKIWLEVLFSTEELEINRDKPIYKQKLIGKVISLPNQTELFTYGSLVYFRKSNILEYTDFTGLFNRYKR